jgi:hypothetical protein
MKIIKINIIQSKSESVLARADVEFEDHLDRGFKILHDAKTNKEYVTPPSYYTPGGWRPLFKTNTKEDWIDLSKQIIKAFNNKLIEESLNEK